jgi:hypothetical protein
MFPNLTLSLDGPGFGFFWACLPMQLGICVAFGTFFRFEQLSKPSFACPDMHPQWAVYQHRGACVLSHQ